jgi:diguanylate cyclase (GGDEF)-like protein
MEAIHQSDDDLGTLAQTSLYFGLAHCFAYGLTAQTLKFVVRRARDDALPIVILLFLLGAAVSSLLAALLGAEALKLSGTLSGVQAQGMWLEWWIGDMTAAMALTPVFLAAISWRYPRVEAWLGGLNFRMPYASLPAYGSKLLVFLTLTAGAMVLAANAERAEAAFTVYFLIIAQMWIVYTESASRAVLSLALFSLTVALGVGWLGLMQQSLVYQFAVMVIAASSLLGLAVPILINRNYLLQQEALTDGLTRVATRRFFFDQAGSALVKARRLQRPVSLVIFDLDHFEEINDRSGHIVGDKVLLAVAQIVRHQLRHDDLIGRFGGDEFMLLLPRCRYASAVELADRLRLSIAELDIDGIKRSISASIAVVEIETDESLMTAFGRADERLLEAKRAGRNRVWQASDSGC